MYDIIGGLAALAGCRGGLMDRQARFEALTVIPERAAVGLAELVLDGSLGDVAVITPPTVGMVMARAADGARGEVFNLGEVLVTEARVSVAGHEGWGMVIGRAPDHALSVAIVDAGLEAGHPQRAAIERELVTLAADAAQSAHQEWQRVAPTRVQFDVF
jgi:alpha-D-ribose 1-methylphosphonate 5-triphosphate synthase subunit PhnG